MTCSLKIEWAENDLMNLVRPGVEQYQKIRSPVGASASKSNNLLRNTFSQEVYNEFLKYKIDKKQQNAIKALILDDVDELLGQLRDVKQQSPPPEFMRSRTFAQKMDIMKESRTKKDEIRAQIREKRE